MPIRDPDQAGLGEAIQVSVSNLGRYLPLEVAATGVLPVGPHPAPDGTVT